MKFMKPLVTFAIAVSMVAGSAASASAMQIGQPGDAPFKTCTIKVQKEFRYSNDALNHAGMYPDGFFPWGDNTEFPYIDLGVNGANYSNVFSGDCPAWESIAQTGLTMNWIGGGLSPNDPYCPSSYCGGFEPFHFWWLTCCTYFPISNFFLATSAKATQPWMGDWTNAAFFFDRDLVADSTGKMVWRYYLSGRWNWPGTWNDGGLGGFNSLMPQQWTGESNCGVGVTDGVSDPGTPGDDTHRCYNNYRFQLSNGFSVRTDSQLSVTKVSRKGSIVSVSFQTSRGVSSCFSGTHKPGEATCDVIKALNNDRVQVKLGGKIVGSTKVSGQGVGTVKFRDKAGKQRYTVVLPEVLDWYGSATAKVRI